MDTLSAFLRAEATKGQERMVFDWEKAARLIRDRKPCEASAGLSSDWEYTGGSIYRDGAPVPKDETYVYLSSTWATPELDMDGHVQSCFRMESETPGWNSDTYWPPEAMAILSESK